jgi:hypothetical protein
MTRKWEESKFLELRAKTDRQLVALVGRLIESGISKTVYGRRAPVERILSEAASLLHRIYLISDADRLRLESGLVELESRLGHQPTAIAAGCPA